MANRNLREVPIYEIGTRTSLLMGADRQLLLALGGLCFLFWYSLPHWWTALISFLTFVVLLKALRMLAKKDPQMKDVFRKHITYKAFYFARSTPFCASKKKFD